MHHACNEACLDENRGNVLIDIDRLLGTFAEPRDVRAARGLGAKLKLLLGAP